MKLTNEQVAFYHENGYLLVKNVFTPGDTNLMCSEMESVIAEDCPRRILEKNGSVRSFFAPHFSNELFDMVSRDERVAAPSAQLLGGGVYLYQSKLNTKAAMCGDWWEWHQDYTYWKQDDGMPRPDVLTAMIFLNDVNEFNGPMLLIPGSHKTGTVDNEAHEAELGDEGYGQYLQKAEYMTSLTADLKYKLKQQTISNWVTSNGLVSATGPAGSVLFFHGNVFHASSNNLSPWHRHTYLLTYNHINNEPLEIEHPRPEFLAIRKGIAIMPVKVDLRDTVTI
jgi:ectoine hydroxylase